MHKMTYDSPLGRILLAADDTGLTGLWFEEQKYYAAGLGDNEDEEEASAMRDAVRWLDLYFSGERPDFTPKLHLAGTPFRRRVWQILLSIPYGSTMTYGEIAAELSGSTAARAVGGAVGHNPVSIIVPCHRVLGSGGSLTGYAGGTWRKQRLLEIEGVLSERKLNEEMQ